MFEESMQTIAIETPADGVEEQRMRCMQMNSKS